MTYANFPTSALLGVIEALPAEETWPLHWIDAPKGATGEYCWPCTQRILRKLGLLDDWGWPTEKMSATDWSYGCADAPQDSPSPCCEYCGRRLDYRLSTEGFRYELAHFESLTDAEIAEANFNEIQVLAWGAYSDDEDIVRRTHDTLLRFLRCRGTPFDPTKYPQEDS